MTLLTTTLILSLLGADPGTAVYPLLKIGQGCRASAMGESFTGLADDASAVYWNPAGLGLIAGHKFDLSHQEWFEGIRDEIGHAAIPLGPGALGFGLAYTGAPGVRYWDPDLQMFNEFDAWNAMLTAGYGWRLAERFTAGVTATGLYEDIQATDAIGTIGYGGTVDLGVTAKIAEGLGAGFAARHLGSMTYGAGFERVPMEFALGAAYSTRLFNFTLDAVAPALDNTPNVRAGIEFIPVRPIALRVGYRTGPVSLGSLGYQNGLTGGVGVTLGNFGLDYAFVPYGELGLTHRIGLRLEVPPPTTGALCVVVLDAETRERLPANLALSGVLDTTATSDELAANRVAPGDVQVRAALEDYEPQAKSLTVVAGRRTQDTLFLRILPSAIRGGVYDARTREPIGGTVVYSGAAAGSIPVPGTPGTYEIDPAKRGSYVMDASGPTDEYLSQTCSLQLAAGQTAQQDFFLWKKGDLLYLMVNFQTGKANILPEFNSDIDRAGAIIKQTPQIRRIELAGHTDPRIIKTEEFPSNWELSQARANAVKQYLVDNFGIDPDRLVTKWYADTRPLVPNTSPENMYKNRRTELKILE